MGSDWIELTDIQSVASAQTNGWEIEFQLSDGTWIGWFGRDWSHRWTMRGRPKGGDIVMSGEWMELRGMHDVSVAQQNGWEIEVQPVTGTDNCCPWKTWSRIHWHLGYLYRGRPARPKMKKVKSLCWRSTQGALTWGGPDWRTDNDNWQRFPAGDLEGEVEE